MAYFFQKGSLLLPAKPAEGLEMPAPLAGDFPVLDAFSIPSIDGGEAISCFTVQAEAALPPSVQPVPVRQIIAQAAGCPPDKKSPIPAMLRAFHIAQWRRESVFCGSCGTRNSDAAAEAACASPARLCPSCGRLEFPRIAPAIITLIYNDKDQILLAHNKKFPQGLYSLIAGFVEAGENLESAVAREIREEVSIAVENIRYIISQPWPFPNSLMAGFSARYLSGDISPDGIEIKDAAWYSRDNLPLLPSYGSVSHYLIYQWLDAKS